MWFHGQRTITRCVVFPPPTGLVCGGDFFGQDAYIGMEFQIEGKTHYGWVRFNHFEIGTGGHILSWAYESEPDVAIAAGDPGTEFIGSAAYCARRTGEFSSERMNSFSRRRLEIISINLLIGLVAISIHHASGRRSASD
jgi:hypothetical protein